VAEVFVDQRDLHAVDAGEVVNRAETAVAASDDDNLLYIFLP